ncbi:MAG TPA: TIGR04551 family protein [Polyangia bacterium]|nr:TIGR04551 family protein [Polyangia bacterium]
MNSRRRRFRPTLFAAAATLAALLAGGRAAAQMGGPGMGRPGGGMPGSPPMGQEPKENGPAEEAPEEEAPPADLEPLQGYANQKRRRMQIVDFDGYLRLRTDYLHNFFLGLGYSTKKQPTYLSSFAATHQNYGLPPFPVPLDCPAPTSTSMDTNPNPFGACYRKDMGGANIRLRIEPTLNVTDQVRVHTQFDVLDNTILGSTPDSLVGLNRPPGSLPGGAPADYLYTTQDPPEVGQNGFVSSVRAKRAWAEIDTEFGSLRFGRMPWHWGRGIAYNDGSCQDCDGATNVDRVMALTQIYGHQLAVAWDLGAQGLTSQQVRFGQEVPGGYPIDLSQNDDVLQLMASIARIDNPLTVRERVDRGELVFNYGVQVVYRSQEDAVAHATMDTTTDTTTMGNQTLAPTAAQLPKLETINARILTPDLWLKLQYRALTLEFEGIGVFGHVDNAGPLAADGGPLSLRQFGWALAGELRLLHDTLFVGLETGGATGDQAEDPSAYLNYRWHFVQQPPGDHRISDFKFSPEYHVDQIFFHQIMGTVTNAIYTKPQIAYWFDLLNGRQLGLNASFIYSIAQVPVSTPGNALNYGFEMDVGANYRNVGEGFYAGVTWAVFFPFAALNRPEDIWLGDARNATAAQMLRIFFGVKF